MNNDADFEILNLPMIGIPVRIAAGGLMWFLMAISHFCYMSGSWFMVTASAVILLGAGFVVSDILIQIFSLRKLGNKLIEPSWWIVLILGFSLGTMNWIPVAFWNTFEKDGVTIRTNTTTVSTNETVKVRAEIRGWDGWPFIESIDLEFDDENAETLGIAFNKQANLSKASVRPTRFSKQGDFLQGKFKAPAESVSGSTIVCTVYGGKRLTRDELSKMPNAPERKVKFRFSEIFTVESSD